MAEERANLSFQMADLNRKLNDPKIPHAERLRVEQEYRSKAEQLDRISIRLKGVPEGMAAEANANVMDAILTKFGNPPKPVTADFLRQQLSDMQNAFAAYWSPLVVRKTRSHCFSPCLCAKGLMNWYVNDSSANNVITKSITISTTLAPVKPGRLALSIVRLRTAQLRIALMWRTAALDANSKKRRYNFKLMA